MDLLIVTPVTLFGQGLEACIAIDSTIKVRGIRGDLGELRCFVGTTYVDSVLVDVTLGIDLDEMRSIASEYPSIVFVALGLQEQRQDVIRCGRAGFSGYVARNVSAAELCKALNDAVAGRLACSAEISGGLLRALFCADLPIDDMHAEAALTQREGDVLRLIGRGMSNKEIARELALSLATVKHHVHHVLAKLKTPRRTHAMRRVREAPWIASPARFREGQQKAE